MEFNEVLQNESELTRPIRDEVYQFEERAQGYLDTLWDVEKDDEDDEEESFSIF